MAGRRYKNAFTFVLDSITDTNSGCLGRDFGWFRCGLRWFGGGLGLFGANMAGQRNKNVFKFLLQLLILSQKHILGVKKVVWDGLEVICGVLEMVWGGLGVSMDPDRSYHFTKKYFDSRLIFLL